MSNDLDRAYSALMAIPANLTRGDWHRVGCSGIAAGLPIEDIDAWSATAGKPIYQGTKAVFAAFKGITADGKASENTLFWFARQNGWSDTGDKPARPAPVMRTPAPPEPPKRTTLSPWGMRLWESTLPISGVAEAYLTHRHCAIPDADSDLHWHPKVKHLSGYVGPALVGLVTDIATDRPMSLHLTWITDTGKKAAVNPQRKYLFNHSLEGGVIKLWHAWCIKERLGVAEGIETALSLAHCVLSWACMDAGHLAKFPVLPYVTELYVAQDNDPGGIAAATQCAERWTQAGRKVVVTQQAKNDLNNEIWA